jgi:hypothetical protein
MEAPAKAAIHEDSLPLVEQFVAQGQRIPDFGGGSSILTTSGHHAASMFIYRQI